MTRRPAPAFSELHSDYSLYFDLEHADGTFTYGYTLPFRAAPEWQRVTGVLVPAKPVHILHVFCIFRFHRGVAHFDDVYVRPLVAQVRASVSVCVAVCFAAAPSLPRMTCVVHAASDSWLD